MKELAGSASISLEAAPEACFELVSSVDRYPSWNPEVIRQAEVLERDAADRPARVRTTVHVAVGPLVRDFDLLMEVRRKEQREVRLTRVRHHASDPERFEVIWRIGSEQPTRLDLELAATLDVPRLVPVGGVGDRLAQGFVEAAKRELEGSSANASASS
jgi:ribosome-associated toxin RatA of RatAB toxin-antitoxin module